MTRRELIESLTSLAARLSARGVDDPQSPAHWAALLVREIRAYHVTGDERHRAAAAAICRDPEAPAQLRASRDWSTRIPALLTLRLLGRISLCDETREHVAWRLAIQLRRHWDAAESGRRSANDAVACMLLHAVEMCALGEPSGEFASRLSRAAARANPIDDDEILALADRVRAEGVTP